MSRTSLVSILFVLSALLLASLICRKRLRHRSREMSTNFDRLLNWRTSAARERCEKLLEGIEASKTVADNALRGPVQTQHLQRALSEILALLAQSLVL